MARTRRTATIGPDEAAGAESRRLHVQRALTRVGAAPWPEHDPERDQVRRGNEDRDPEEDQATLPALDPAQSDDEQDERDQGEREAVEEPEADAVREAAVGLIADAVRPPAGKESAGREEDEDGDAERDEHGHRAGATLLGHRGTGDPAMPSAPVSHVTRRRSSTAAASTSLKALRPAEAGVRSPVRLNPARSYSCWAGSFASWTNRTTLVEPRSCAHSATARMRAWAIPRPRAAGSTHIEISCTSSGFDAHERADDAEPPVVLLGDEQRLLVADRCLADPVAPRLVGLPDHVVVAGREEVGIVAQHPKARFAPAAPLVRPGRADRHGAAFVGRGGELAHPGEANDLPLRGRRSASRVAASAILRRALGGRPFAAADLEVTARALQRRVPPLHRRPAPPARLVLRRRDRGRARVGDGLAHEPGSLEMPWTELARGSIEAEDSPRHARHHEGDDQIRTGVRGFAGLCLTTRPRRQTEAS